MTLPHESEPGRRIHRDACPVWIGKRCDCDLGHERCNIHRRRPCACDDVYESDIDGSTDSGRSGGAERGR